MRSACPNEFEITTEIPWIIKLYLTRRRVTMKPEAVVVFMKALIFRKFTFLLRSIRLQRIRLKPSSTLNLNLNLNVELELKLVNIRLQRIRLKSSSTLNLNLDKSRCNQWQLCNYAFLKVYGSNLPPDITPLFFVRWYGVGQPPLGQPPPPRFIWKFTQT